MRTLFRDLPEAITNTERLADRLMFSLENIGYEFPEFPVPGGHSMDSFLRTIVLFGANNIPEQWLRYLERGLRERFGFEGTPIRFVTRARDRKSQQRKRAG